MQRLFAHSVSRTSHLLRRPATASTTTTTAFFVLALLSMSSDAAVAASKTELATFGAGCYWGTEKFFRKDFQKQFPGALRSATVGFMGGDKPNPSYREVCSGASGHVEVLHVEYDTSACTFSDLTRFFFSFHDPTTKDRQGNDKGTQYASVVFTHSDAQAATANAVKADVTARLQAGTLTMSGRAFEGKEVTTAVVPAGQFFPAHAEHQQYLEANPNGYCNHSIRFKWSEQQS